MLRIEMMTYQTNDAHVLAGTVVLERLIHADDKSQTHFLQLISRKLPYHILNDDAVQEIWQDVRDADAGVVEFLLVTYSTLRLYIPDDAEWQNLIKLYATAYGAKSFTNQSYDQQFLDGTVDASYAVKLLEAEAWMMVILSMYTFDLEEVVRRNGQNKRETTEA